MAGVEEWEVNKHPYIGKRIAAFFPLVSKVFIGEVGAVSRELPTLYRIVYEDGDFADFDEEQLQEGLELFEVHSRELAERNGWTFTDESIGLHVAAKFSTVVHFPTRTTAIRKLFEGEVTRFAPAVEGSPALWHIRWDDGDEEDFEKQQFDEGVQLWKATRRGASAKDNHHAKVKQTAQHRDPEKRIRRCEPDTIDPANETTLKSCTIKAVLTSLTSSSSSSMDEEPTVPVDRSSTKYGGYATSQEHYAARRFKKK